MEKVKMPSHRLEAFETQPESYGLNWPGKREALLAADAPAAKTLIPYPDESVEFETTRNLFIEGDNLDALKLLRETLRGKVKMIYIDPPYNTGQDLIYHDDFTADPKSYRERTSSNCYGGCAGSNEANGRSHSEWLSMIYPRLSCARELLREDGCIFISIDDNEAARLRLVCDEIFGEECFVNQIVVKSSETSGVKMSHVGRRLPKIKEYILVYGRTPGGCRFNPVAVRKYGDSPEAVDAYLKYYRSFVSNPEDAPEKWRIVSVLDEMRRLRLETTNDAVRRFKLDNADRVVYRTNNSLLASMSFDTPTAEVISPRGKRYVWWEGKQMLFLSDYLTESLCDLWTDISTINLNKEMLGLPAFAKGQKPLALLERCLKMACREGEESIVVDFFAGSGSMGHAAMRAQADGFKVRFILVQRPERINSRNRRAGFDTIAEIAKERLRRAGKEVGAAANGKQVDTGFRVLKIKEAAG